MLKVGLQENGPRAEDLRVKKRMCSPRSRGFGPGPGTHRLHDSGKAPLSLSCNEGAAAEIKWQNKWSFSSLPFKERKAVAKLGSQNDDARYYGFLDG